MVEADRGARLGDHGALRRRREARADRRRARARRGHGYHGPPRPRGRERPTRRSSAASAPARACVRGRRSRSRSTTRALHFFDPETGSGIYDDKQRERSNMSRKRMAAVGMLAGRHGDRARLPPRSQARGRTARSHVSAVSGSISFDGIWTSSTGQKQFADVIKAFNKLYPKVHVNYKPNGNNIPTILTTAVAGGHPPDMADIAQPGLIQQFVKQKAAEADHVRDSRRSRRTSGRRGRSSGRSTASCTRSSSRRPTSRSSGTTCPPSRRPA